jgi:hypothetical protein
LRAIAHAEFGEDAAHVCLDGLLADAESFGRYSAQIFVALAVSSASPTTLNA